MQIIYALLISTIAGLSTMIGCLFIYFKPQNTHYFIGASLAFSASIMLLISITELVPEGFIYLTNKYSIFLAIFSLLGLLLLGNMISTRLNTIISKYQAINSNLYRVGVLSMLALMIHNLPEGILTFLSSVVDLKLGLKLSFAIMMHNIPEGIAIAVPIYYATKRRVQALWSTFISGLSEPLGAVLAWIFLSKYINGTLMSLILLFTAGLMISVAINDIFMEANKYSRKSILVGVLFAVVLFIINSLVFI